VGEYSRIRTNWGVAIRVAIPSPGVQVEADRARFTVEVRQLAHRASRLHECFLIVEIGQCHWSGSHREPLPAVRPCGGAAQQGLPVQFVR
jgi:hypothetical protein